jgi:hypothetical protein
MLLCDAAQDAGGKLYILGGGWNALLQPEVPTSVALGIVLHLEWTEANQRHRIEIELRTADGELWEQDGRPMQLQTEVEVGRPAGHKPGTEFNVPLAPTFHGLTLPAGGYVWTLSVNGDPPLGRCPFSVGVPHRPTAG